MSSAFARAKAAARTSLACRYGAWCSVRNASTFVVSCAVFVLSTSSSVPVSRCASGLPFASSTVRNGMPVALKSAPSSAARSMFLSKCPTSTRTTSYSYINLRATGASFVSVPWSATHQPHQFAPHWISTRRFSVLARASAALRSARASAASSYTGAAFATGLSCFAAGSWARAKETGEASNVANTSQCVRFFMRQSLRRFARGTRARSARRETPRALAVHGSKASICAHATARRRQVRAAARKRMSSRSSMARCRRAAAVLRE